MWLRTTADYDSLPTLSADEEATPMVFAQDFRHVELNIFSSSVTTGYTLSVFSSDQEARPILTSAVSATNKYSLIQVTNKNTWANVTGTAGIVVTANGLLKFEINDNKSRWYGVRITTHADGICAATFNMADNS